MSKPNLEKDKKLVVDTIRKLKSSKDLSSFIDDLLTEEEILDLAQRLKIAQLILAGKNYDEISEAVGTSTSTVSKIGQVLKYGKGGLEKVLKKTKGGVKK
ncbi:helix-turn-helix domain-containing protein [Candidatus Microgenomates bacterium]|nr:helix-turn-helix domain-containing protein [Candidatus Microgenomates bacterium]